MFDGERFTAGLATVVLDGDTIVGVEDGHPDLGPDCQVIDVTDLTALPGLIDAHVHLVCDSRPGALDRAAVDPDPGRVIAESLQRQLAAGVTTVRDLGDRNFAVVDHRSRIVAERRTEPTVIASGPPLTPPAGHCHFLGGVVDGSAAITRAIREHADRGVDLIKVMASGGMSTPGTATVEIQFTDAELAQIVREGHAAGLPVTAHATGSAPSSRPSRPGSTASSTAAACAETARSSRSRWSWRWPNVASRSAGSFRRRRIWISLRPRCGRC